VAITRYVLAWNDRRRRRRIISQGKEGEDDAVRLLKKKGYTIRACHHRAFGTMSVDGRQVRFPFVIDILAEKDGERVVVESKNSVRDARPSHAETRRQLLEYRCYYPGANAVKLYDAVSKKFHDIEFEGMPSNASRGTVRYGLFIAGFLLGLLCTGNRGNSTPHLRAHYAVLARRETDRKRHECPCTRCVENFKRGNTKNSFSPLLSGSFRIGGVAKQRQ
jgi:hypothetical protein